MRVTEERVLGLGVTERTRERGSRKGGGRVQGTEWRRPLAGRGPGIRVTGIRIRG